MSRLENREKFMELMRKTERAGVEDMLKWLDTTDFYSAPASTRYHGSYPGGLVQHTLNVAYELKQLVDFYDVKIPKDSILICALGHDFCKINTYRETIVNVPPQRTKSGKWEQQQGYKKDEYLKLGHGAKSLSTLQDFITLKDYEKEAIYWHMGAFDLGQYNNINDLSKTFEENPLAFLLHIADMCVTYIIENEREEE